VFAELAAGPVYGSSGRPVRYLAPRGAVVTEARLDHVVFCRYRSDGTTALRPMPRHEGLQELFANCASVPHPLALCDVEALVDWSSTIAFHRLDVADLGKAVDLLQQEP
jgi:hypothetical protein